MIEDPRVVVYSNEVFRPAMDRLARAYWAAKKAIAAWDAQGLAPLVPMTADHVADSQESYKPLTAGGLALSIQNMRTMIAQLETVDPQTGISMAQGVLAVAINGAVD